MKEGNHITGIILAGGKSSRMGTDKGFVILKNKPFVQHIIDTLTPLVNDIIIVSDNPDYDKFNIKRVEDIIKESGPLAGLYSGLFHSKTEQNIVLSCDIPLVNTQILNQLIATGDEAIDVVQCQVQDKTMPLIALYKKRVLNDCLTTLESGERRLRVFINQLNTKTVHIEQTLEKYTANINTKDQLKQLQHDTDY